MDNQIIDAMDMAKALAHKWHMKNPRYDIEDYLGVCNLSIAKSLKNFDSSKGVKFTTYAYTACNREIYRILTDDKRYNVRRGQALDFELLPISLDKAHYKNKNDVEVKLVDMIPDCEKYCYDIEVLEFIETVVRENTKDRYRNNVDRDIEILKRYIIYGYGIYFIGKQMNMSGQLVTRVVSKFKENSKKYIRELV